MTYHLFFQKNNSKGKQCVSLTVRDRRQWYLQRVYKSKKGKTRKERKEEQTKNKKTRKRKTR